MLRFVIGLAVLTLVGTDAWAQGADVRGYRAPIIGDGLPGEMGTQTLRPMDKSMSLVFDYALRPVAFRYEDGSFDPVINHRLIAEVAAAMGVIQYIDVGFALPTTLLQEGPKNAAADLGFSDLRGVAAGDLRLQARVQMTEAINFGFSSTLVLEVTAPTGKSQTLNGDPGASFRPKVIIQLPLPWFEAIGSFGYVGRKNEVVADVPMSDRFDFHLGAMARPLGEDSRLTFLLEYAGSVLTSQPFRGEGSFQTELLGGVRAHLNEGLSLMTAMGGGLARGVGTPAFRWVLGVTYAPVSRDLDRDGIEDALDQCPNDAEDRDEFHDDDGCPDLDNDHDGIPDVRDACPMAPEETNDFEDDDGCPDSAQKDTDRDGIIDTHDRCPDRPEDIDKFKDEDGCPDFDNDIDGILDGGDQCPTEKETINGVDDDDGCPDVGDAITDVTANKIEIKQTVLFESGKAIIKEESKPLLNQVALQILANPHITLVRIEGHTDSLGDAEDNLFLSQDRSDAVLRYLVLRGVAEERLAAEGFGETMPIASNDSVQGRTLNRRVDFVIHTRDEQEAEQDIEIKIEPEPEQDEGMP